jgi:chorismate-pyruvate lyase
VPDEVRAALRPATCETIHYRQGQLMRGSLPLATAENWFVPQRLTERMNEILHQTEIPFGMVIAPLRPSRRTLVACAWPLTDDPVEDPPRLSGRAYQPRLEIILEHKAVIFAGSRTALALVKESFFSELVSFAFTTSPCTRATECEV